MKEDSIVYLNAIAQTIFDRKGTNILALDVRNVSTLTDYLLIAEGNVDKHVTALAHAVIERLERMGLHPICVAGIKHGDWVVIDYLNIIVHLFMPGLRDKYQLEQLFREASIVDLKIDVIPKTLSGLS